MDGKPPSFRNRRARLSSEGAVLFGLLPNSRKTRCQASMWASHQGGRTGRVGADTFSGAKPRTTTLSARYDGNLCQIAASTRGSKVSIVRTFLAPASSARSLSAAVRIVIEHRGPGTVRSGTYAST